MQEVSTHTHLRRHIYIICTEYDNNFKKRSNYTALNGSHNFLGNQEAHDEIRGSPRNFLWKVLELTTNYQYLYNNHMTYKLSVTL